MIVSFRHRALARLYEHGERRGVPPTFVNKIERILARLDVATEPTDMNLPGYRLHPLGGDRRGYWSVRVSGNWRIIFRFTGMNVCEVDLLDYH